MDPLLLLAQLLLGAFSLLGVAAAAPEMFGPDSLRLAAALLITLIVALIPPRLFVRIAKPLFIGTVLLLVAVLIKGSGPFGVHRWFYFGSLSFQPSELMKVAMVIYLASYFDRHGTDYPILGPILAVGLAVGLIALEPDFSTALFHLFLAVFLLLVVGVPWRRLIAIGTATILLALSLQGLYLNKFGYITARFTGFLDRLHGEANISAAGYQNFQALSAVLAGGLLGQGAGAGIPYVPAGWNDMILSAITYASGWLGALMVLVIFTVVFTRGLQIAAKSQGAVSVMALGLTTYLTLQAAINFGVTLGVLPVTGIPLPMVSYGGSSMVVAGLAFGILHGISRQAFRSSQVKAVRKEVS